ncbi:MAG TPA: hypothetical protein VLJ41_05415, partial [Segetibacter sp.]|nr:hypothetical protein [Segetibacter sp.]
NYLLTEERIERETVDEDLAAVSPEVIKKEVSEASNASQDASQNFSHQHIEDDAIQSVKPVDEAKNGGTSHFEEDVKELENKEVSRALQPREEVELKQIVEVEENFHASINDNERHQNSENNYVGINEQQEVSDDLVDISPAAALEITELKEEMAGVANATDQTTEKFLEEAEHEKQKEKPEPYDEHDRMFQNIKAMLDASSEEASADTKDAVIPLDPYYTIDYFASQGIKLELDQNPQDQLGQHLKKFTQWLKHMKKLGPEDATEAINRTETEEDIQQIADSSNTVREVVTEAMAAVLEKQGKKDKAIELYNKLSFLNPDKRAYFADKIKKLKGI